MGLLWFIRFFKKFQKYGIILFLSILYLFNIGIYIDRYYVHFPYEESQYWGSLYQQLNTVLSQKQFIDKKIIMEDPESSPYIFFLFYNSYDPLLYQNQVIRYPMTPEGFVHVKAFGRYEFRSVDLIKDPYLPKTVVVIKTTNIPPYFINRFKTTNILLPSGDPMYSIIEIKDDAAVQ